MALLHYPKRCYILPASSKNPVFVTKPSQFITSAKNQTAHCSLATAHCSSHFPYFHSPSCDIRHSPPPLQARTVDAPGKSAIVCPAADSGVFSRCAQGFGPDCPHAL